MAGQPYTFSVSKASLDPINMKLIVFFRSLGHWITSKVREYIQVLKKSPGSYHQVATLPQTKIAPEKWWFWEDPFPFGILPIFRGYVMLVSGSVYIYIHILWMLFPPRYQYGCSTTPPGYEKIECLSENKNGMDFSLRPNVLQWCLKRGDYDCCTGLSGVTETYLSFPRQIDMGKHLGF